MKEKCGKCGALVENTMSLQLYKDRLLCPDCLAQEAEAPNVCPNCGTRASVAHQVGMVLVPPGYTTKQKQEAPVYYAVVCPKCKVIYFDEFQYNTLPADLGPG